MGRVLFANRRTWFGLRHGFEHIGTLRAYQGRVSAGDVRRLRRARQADRGGRRQRRDGRARDVAGTDERHHGGEKLIPYTAGLRRQFQRGIAAWIADLFSRRPAVRRGRAFWSISPALGPPRVTSGGLPIGFADDAEYLGRLESFALRRLLVVPEAVARLPEMIAFRYCTLLFLLAAEDLSLISIWNPTFLLALLSSLNPGYERLCDDLARGEINPPLTLDPGLRAVLRKELRPMPRRAAILKDIGRSAGSLADKLALFWPELALISCWTDAAAGQFVPQLRELFPRVEIQPKGLLATEAFVSFPQVGQTGGVLAVRSHVFEFEEISGRGFKLAHELDRGGRYRVLVTTAGGLYRYQLRDEVEIVGFHHQCPLLRFLGKSDQISDLIGEKLAEMHVRTVLERLPVLSRLRPRFMMLVPAPGSPPCYRLYLQGPSLENCASGCLSFAASWRRGSRKTLTTGTLSPWDNWRRSSQVFSIPRENPRGSSTSAGAWKKDRKAGISNHWRWIAGRDGPRASRRSCV